MQPNVMELMTSEFEPMIGPYINLLQKYYKEHGSNNPEADAMLAHALLDGITLNFIMTHHDFDMEYVKNIIIKRLENPSF